MTQMPWTPAVTESSRLRNYWSAWSSRRGRREPESTAAAVPEPKLKIKQSAFKLWRGRTHWKYSVCIRDKSQGPSSGVPTPQQYINRAEKDVELHHFGHMPVCLLPPSQSDEQLRVESLLVAEGFPNYGAGSWYELRALRWPRLCDGNELPVCSKSHRHWRKFSFIQLTTYFLWWEISLSLKLALNL